MQFAANIRREDFTMEYGYSDAGYGALAAFMGTYSVVVLLLCVLIIVGMWKVFAKAGEPGWAAIIPFYNSYVLFKIAMGNGWLFLLSFIPAVGSIAVLVAYFMLAGKFGKGTGFGIGMVLLSPIFLLILAFGDAEYVG